MPTYEYLCDKCGHKFDYFQSITADALSVCPKENCGLKSWGKGKVRRAIGGGAGLIFKGSGFYITDYRSEGYKAAAKKESSAGSSTSSGSGESKTSGTKSESTPPASGSKSTTSKSEKN